MKSSPAFQFYPHDFLVGTAELTAEETGAYIRLLCYQWAKGSLPNNEAKLAQLASCHGNAIASIWHKFRICEDGLLRNERLEKVRESQEEYRKRQSKNAKEGWKHRVGNATAMPPHMPEACSSSSSSSSNKDIIPSGAERSLKPLGKPQRAISPKAWDFIKLWKSKHLEFFGVPFKEDGEFDGMAADALISLDGYTMEALMEIAEKAWKNPDGFWSKFASSISGFSKKFNEIRKEVGSLQSKKPYKPETTVHLRELEKKEYLERVKKEKQERGEAV